MFQISSSNFGSNISFFLKNHHIHHFYHIYYLFHIQLLILQHLNVTIGNDLTVEKMTILST